MAVEKPTRKPIVCPYCGVEFAPRNFRCTKTCGKEKCRKADKKAYHQTPEYKAWEKVYRQTPESKACEKVYSKVYRQTPKYKANKKVYRQTPKCKAYRKSYWKVYRQTPEYKAWEKAHLRLLAARRAALKLAKTLTRLLELEKENEG